MKRLIPILFLLICIPNLGYADIRAPKELHVGELIIIEGCRGEYCYQFCDDTIEIEIDQRDGVSTSYWFRKLVDGKFSEQVRSENPIGIKASSPFTFYSDLDGPSPIATCDAGVIVKPIEQKIVVRDRGDYLVEEVMNKSSTYLKVGDKIDTPISSSGEGFTIVRRNGRWQRFFEPSQSDLTRCFSTGDCSDLKLKVNREAKVETWIKLEVGGVVGFAPDDGFLICWLGSDLPAWRSYLGKLWARLGSKQSPLPTYCTPYSA